MAEMVLGAEPPSKAISLSDSERAELIALPRDSDLVIELDCLYSPGLVTDGSRPYFPWMSLVVDAHNGLVLATELENSETEKLEHAARDVPVARFEEVEMSPKANPRDAHSHCDCFGASRSTTRYYNFQNILSAMA